MLRPTPAQGGRQDDSSSDPPPSAAKSKSQAADSSKATPNPGPQKQARPIAADDVVLRRRPTEATNPETALPPAADDRRDGKSVSAYRPLSTASSAYVLPTSIGLCSQLSGHGLSATNFAHILTHVKKHRAASEETGPWTVEDTTSLSSTASSIQPHGYIYIYNIYL